MQLARAFDGVARHAGWLAANLAVGVALCWCGFHLQQEGFAPAGLFPLLLGSALGAAGAAIARALFVRRGVAIAGAAALGLLAVVGQDYIGHRYHLRSYEASLRAQESAVAAALADSAAFKPDFRQYLFARVREHPVWWVLDVALTAGAAAVVSAVGTRGARRTAAPSDEDTRMSQIVGIGTDIIECLRIAQMIERHGELFINRVYTPHEIQYCQSRRQSTQHYAGRWAAKEAVLKALGTGWRRGISWRDIEIRNDPKGRPTVALRGGARDVVEQLGITEMLVSISHCRSHATAYALAQIDGKLFEGE